MAVPALSRNYSTRANIPFSSTATQVIIESHTLWNLARCLLDHATDGTLSTLTARHANSIWICRGSSDAVTGGAVSSVGVAGTNRWGTSGAFPGAFTRGNNSTNHHWMLLENVTLGYELLLTPGQTAAAACISMGPSGTFSGGTVSANPTPSPTTASVQMKQVAYGATDGGQTAGAFQDSTSTGSTYRSHFTVADNGEFLFSGSRAGTGKFGFFIALWRTTGQQVGDTLNTFLIGNTSGFATAVGMPLLGFENHFIAGRCPSGAQKSTGGHTQWVCDNGSGVNAFVTQSSGGISGVDSINSQYIVAPIYVMDTAPQFVFRGVLPDLYSFGGGQTGNSIPSSAAQLYTVMGQLICPFIDVAPLI